MGGALYYQMMIACKAIALLLAAAIAPEEIDLLAGSLRPEGRAEIESNAAPVSALPVSEVQAELDPSKARVDGQLRLVVRNRETAPWSEIVLRAYPNAVRGTSLRVDDVRVEGKRVLARSHGSVIAVPVELAPGASVSITLAFHGQLRRLREGEDDLFAQVPFGKVDRGYGTFAAGRSGAALVDWYPQLAARAHGVWDREEPGPLGDVGHADPSSAVVALTVPHGWKVAAAGTALGQHPVSAARETATFAAAGIRGALGMAASPSYEEVIETASGVEVRASSMHGEPRALLSCARQALGSLQARFGPYPWASFAVAEVQLTGGAGGVELPGFALVARALAPGGAAPAGLFEFTCYHEVAHQWWQGVVGSDPRRAPWVDEALAQYSAVLVTEDVHGKDAAEQALSTYVALNYHGMRLARVADGRVARGADEFPSALSYAGLIYGKAPLFFAAARGVLGDAGFDAVTRAYRQTWAFREAGGDAWLQAVRRAAPDRLAEIAALQKRWWWEKHGDEDIAPADGLALMQALGGGGDSFAQLLRALQDNSDADDAQVREALKQLQRLIPELSRMLQSE